MVHALASCGSGFRQANPRWNRRSAYPSEVIMSRRKIVSSRATHMRVPTTCVLLLSGIPATGKSSFGRYLARDHNFAHYDLECHPRGWPHPELKPVWDWSRADFAAQLKVFHPRVALDWGFPIGGISWVRELLAAGVRLVWFAGDIARARELFLKRGGVVFQTCCLLSLQTKFISVNE
jgi:hypothetical protein